MIGTMGTRLEVPLQPLRLELLLLSDDATAK
jgi:hypothetical protein